MMHERKSNKLTERVETWLFRNNEAGRFALEQWTVRARGPSAETDFGLQCKIEIM